MQDTLLEDLERIEIIRGPGAALWGANAVNGVINIITKRAKDTQGTLLSGGGGTEERGFGNVRYGGKLGEGAHVRVYAKYFNRDESVLPTGDKADDAWQVARSGFRMDWDASDRNVFTLAGDLYSGTLAQAFLLGTLLPPFQQTMHDDLNIRGGNLIARWSHIFSDVSDMRLQVYYDHTVRDTLIFKEDRDNYDIDFQHRFPLGERQDVIWGVGYRLTTDDVGNSFTVSLNPQSRTTRLLSAFAQDEITPVPDRLRLTLGSKFEQNDFTGFEIQPRGRLSWTPNDWHTIWAAISRAVRTPSRAEDDIRLSQQVLPAGRLFPGAHAGRDLSVMPQLILLDLKLPKIDGLEVLRRLRADDRTKFLPVVILTSSNEEQDLLAGYSLGANSYVRKPVDFGQFVDAVCQLGLYWLVLNLAPPVSGLRGAR